MPPPSSPVPRLSYVPSDVYTVNTIASRSPLRHLVSAIRGEGRKATPSGSGRCYRHTSPHIAADRPAAGQRLDGLPSFPPRPRSLPSCGDVGQSKRNRKRGNQGEGCRRHLRPFLASLLFRLMSSPSTPSPAAHHFARLCQRSWRGTGCHLVRFWVMSSPHLATTSPATRSHRAAHRRSSILPASSPHLFPSVRW